MSLWGTLLMLLSVVYLISFQLVLLKEYSLLLIAFVYVLLLGYTRIHYFSYSFVYIFKFFLLFVVGIVFTDIVKNSNRKKISGFFFYAICTSAIFAIGNIIYTILLGNNVHFHLLGFFQYKQHQGLLYAFVFPFVFFYKSSKYKFFFLFLIGVLIVLSFDRKAILFVFFFLLIKDLLNKTFFTGIFLSFLVFLSVIFYDNFIAFYLNKISNEIDVNNLSGLGSGRLGIYFFSIDYFINQMNFLEKLFGQGTGTNFIAHLSTIKTMKNAHIDVVHFLLDYGILFLAYISYILYRFYIMVSKRQKTIIVVIAISLLYSIPSVYGLISLLLVVSTILVGNSSREREVF